MEEIDSLQSEQVQNDEAEIPQKSKSQIKKEIQKQKWLADKEKRKQKEKLKKHERKEQRRLEREANPEKYEKKDKANRNPEDIPLPNKKIKEEYKKLVNEGQPIIIDCSFKDWLKEKELISLCRQIGYCHAANKKVAKPAKIIVTCFKDKLKNQLVKMGAENWGIHLLDKHYLDYYSKEELIYLTGDTNEDIGDLDKGTAYIIGGLVDHNRYKFATLEQAKKEGLRVRRLPISQNINLKSSTILSVNHVFDIMLKVSNGENWHDAINNSIPIRKREGTEEKKKKKRTRNKVNEETKEEEKGQEQQEDDEESGSGNESESEDSENMQEEGKGGEDKGQNDTEAQVGQDVIQKDGTDKQDGNEGNVSEKDRENKGGKSIEIEGNQKSV